MRHKPISEQVMVVMGASTGIGRLLASEAARRGARVVVAARSEEPLGELVDEIRDRGGRALAVVADTTSPEDARVVAETAERELGRIDTWVQMAAVAIYSPFEKLTPEEFERVIRVNLVGQAYGAMAALPVMRRHGGGGFIAVSSVEAEVALPYHSSYAAAKHGVKGMLDSLRMELKHDKVPISITNVMPASINTPFFDHARTKLGVKPQGLPPLYDPAVVVEAILRAAEKPRREVIVGGSGRFLVPMHRRYPRFVEAMLRRTAFRGQETREPRGEEHPDNVDAPSGADSRVRGEEGREARGGPVQRRRRMGGPVPWVGVAALALGFVARRLLHRRASTAFLRALPRALPRALHRSVRRRSAHIFGRGFGPRYRLVRSVTV